ncbi:MAG: hypothetical protein U0872_17045 [Planctomycetaceae bacterium]
MKADLREIVPEISRASSNSFCGGEAFAQPLTHADVLKLLAGKARWKS